MRLRCACSVASSAGRLGASVFRLIVQSSVVLSGKSGHVRFVGHDGGAELIMVRASIFLVTPRRWILSLGHRHVGPLGLVAMLLAAGPSAAKQNSEVPPPSPVFLISEVSQGSDNVAKAVAAALGNPSDLRRWTLTFSNRMEPGIRVYANGHDPKPLLARLDAAGLKAALVDAPVGVPYSVLTSSRDRIFLIIGPTS